MNNTYGYTRVSQQSDTSIDRQKSKIRDYAAESNLELINIFDDGEFASGYDDQRSEYLELKSVIKLESTGAVVVSDKTRIGRDFDERLRFILDLREYDVTLHSAREGMINLSEPISAGLESIHAAKDDESKREEIRKSTEAVEERIESGYDHGRPRFGMTYDSKGQYQVPGQNYHLVEKVFELRSTGKTYLSIASEIDGVTKSTAQRIINRRDWYEERAKMA